MNPAQVRLIPARVRRNKCRPSPRLSLQVARAADAHIARSYLGCRKRPRVNGVNGVTGVNGVKESDANEIRSRKKRRARGRPRTALASPEAGGR